MECQILFCMNPSHQTHSLMPYALFASFSLTPASWYFDFGATYHLTTDHLQVQNSKPYQGDQWVILCNGQAFFISTWAKTSSKLFLPHLLHVSHLSDNLISIQKLVADNFFLFLLDDTRCKNHWLSLVAPTPKVSIRLCMFYDYKLILKLYLHCL